ncbi:MAG TPA: hypothetical protein VMT30_05100 [Candidatus Saccharimonadia bacterium]|nr:hypothetical protein [Candidatus Saccharimonadia bacterium]
MKKPLSIVSLAAVSAAALLAAQPTQAAGTSTIAGPVIKQRQPVVGVVVSVYCGRMEEHHHVADSAPTDATGHYRVTITEAQCPRGHYAQVFAGTSFEWVGLSAGNLAENNRFDIYLEHRTSIPEYSWLAGLLADSAGFGAIAMMRRRQVAHREQ